jgi:RNA polymerase sigma-B factor
MDEFGPERWYSDVADDALRELFERYRANRDRALRNELIEAHRPLAARLARRYRMRGEPIEDLEQVALLGVLKAVERFDPDRGSFVAFATVTVNGELKRHLRDRTWRVRAPRQAKERSLQIGRAVEALGHRHGRAPTITEIALELGCTEDDVLMAIEVGASYRNVNPDGRDGDYASGWTAPRMPAGDDDYEAFDDRELVRDLLDILPARERTICELRFVDELTQSEIASRVGISQMHVSRLLRASIEQMRSRALTSQPS